MHSALKNACTVLLTADPTEKVAAAHRLRSDWEHDPVICDSSAAQKPSLPLSPARPATPKLVNPADVPRRRLGSEQGRAALLHAVAHIEFNAIDLAADMIARFGMSPLIPDEKRGAFITDWVMVCDDEARHFTMITQRMAMGSLTYGALPAHNGLWEAAQATADNLPARLAIAPMVLEARGLDVTPPMIEKLKKAGDDRSAAILQIIYDEEIGHVRTGSKWFHFIAAAQQKEPETFFKALVKTYFKGLLKPPFNVPARDKAEIPERYYNSALKFT